MVSVTKSIFSDKYDSFRRLLIKARKDANVTQSQLAVTLLRPQSYVSKYERGERRLDVVEFLEVAKTLGIDPTDFLQLLEDALSPAASKEQDESSTGGDAV